MATLTIQHWQGAEIAAGIDALAALRIRVFRAWPYLYDGSLEYERSYLRTYVEAPSSLVAAVFDGDELVGATTALPMPDEEPSFRHPLSEAGFDITTVFYFGESLLLPAYRGRGLGHAFFDAREAHAAALGYTTTCFCAVNRPADHPARPADYRPLDAFWRGRGYQPRADIVARYDWRDRDDTEQTTKTLTFWLRDLNP
ncbi:GNAT family N-acetyltransferase [Salinisphaera sp. SPP-AMP-43]|uniref:GNAT family N-acetyltransferase n=1 Tax=Salinisphaera sp. SPP-AMP-43 TaxID=3121288 RepID=UPI003C6DF37D